MTAKKRRNESVNGRAVLVTNVPSTPPALTPPSLALPPEGGGDKNVKKPWHSKIIWFNTLAGLAVIASQTLPTLQSLLTAQDYAVALAAVTVINQVLRMVTTTSISVSTDDSK